MLLSLSLWPPRRRSNKTGSRTSPAPYLNDKQWLVIADLFPHKATGGRPRVHPRACLEGVLWVLISGARWKDLPERYPSPATCWRRLKEWTESGVFLQAWTRLLSRLDELNGIDWDEVSGDGTFCRAKKGAMALA